MTSLILVSEPFDAVWPFAGDHLHSLWRTRGDATIARVAAGQTIDAAGVDLRGVRRLAALGADLLTPDALARLPALAEVAFSHVPAAGSPLAAALSARGVAVYGPTSQGFWGQSVTEFALALTLCALRQLPQRYRAMIDSLDPWDFSPPGGVGTAGMRGQQFGDDPAFVNGTIAGKRVRVIGMGNIGARFASWCAMLGADVAGWDPVAPDPCFHRTGTRRVTRLEELVADAEILAPMVPLVPKTEGLVNAGLIAAIPRGALLVMVTRMQVCDTAAVRARVLADELLLAADVFDVEPLPLGDPLLGRHNVIHAPHVAGRTIHSNQQYAEELARQFRA